jgi:hypothetical protein
MRSSNPLNAKEILKIYETEQKIYPIRSPTLLQWKSGFIRGMTSLEEDN